MKSNIYGFFGLFFLAALVVASGLLLGGYSLFIWGPVIIWIFNQSHEPQQDEPNQAND